ncbi:thiamine biosynthesis protein ThiJ [Chimaeribacter californicus]|uniref:Thiamine biosynthesis protein ThiJ n=1 Tax=Chimaeribacter californicus TaxID=2060067 RepID=A0A2N5DWC4_9GAMM|nr:DJ-1/PfpI family protein [Chimaeribacter californicus]PLR31475.1 thiamine biosynthesis protein ThiJ [Chimaeribacter californicus]
MSGPLSVGFLLFPHLTQLDLTGPYEVFVRAPYTRVHLIWKTLDPVTADRGLGLLPTTTFADCPDLDVLCVPGGPGQIDLMEDRETLAFLRDKAQRARLITSVCTGSLVLGAAGLLQGYRATSHWASLDQLALLGAEPVAERVVHDRNRITGAGVTSGIDFALHVVAEIYGTEVAQLIQLHMEYDPAPPFPGGSPHSASPALLHAAREQSAAFIEKRRAVTERAAAALQPSDKES